MKINWLKIKLTITGMLSLYFLWILERTLNTRESYFMAGFILFTATMFHYIKELNKNTETK